MAYLIKLSRPWLCIQTFESINLIKLSVKKRYRFYLQKKFCALQKTWFLSSL